jgi:hypothetical protein
MSDSVHTLYRIVKFHHAVEILTGTLHFSHPSKWDDPYEMRVKDSRNYALFAQCWGKKSMSDAMWRVYSPDHLGVRIKTSRTKLESAMQAFTRANHGYLRRLKDVEYSTTKTVAKRTEGIVCELNERWNPSAAADLLFHKRSAFEHEAEVRAVIFCPARDETRIDSGLKVEINGHDFVESILFDPRAPDTLVDALKYYLKSKLGYDGHIGKSKLYTKPEEEWIVADDNEL